MKLFLIRHADADAEVPDGLGDEGRALTVRGRLTAAQHFADLAGRIAGLELVLSSPLVRSVQTAQLLASAVGYEGPLRAHRCLLPDMPVGAIDAALQENLGAVIALVGHQPSMGAMAAHLLGLPSFPKPVAPGTVIGLDIEEAGGGTRPSRLVLYAAPGQSPLDSL